MIHKFEGLAGLPQGEILFTEQQILEKEREIAEILVQGDPDLEKLYVCILKGGLPFFMDIVYFIKELTGHNPRIAYIKASSYDGQQSGDLSIEYDIDFDIKGEDIVALDDVGDTNGTQLGLYNHLVGKRHAASFELIPLVLKDNPKKVASDPTHYGFLAPDRWLGGMGMDLGNPKDPDDGRAYRTIFAID
jgi:hypoxanthine phosphoribosyltransferase